MSRCHPRSTLFPYTTLFRSAGQRRPEVSFDVDGQRLEGGHVENSQPILRGDRVGAGRIGCEFSTCPPDRKSTRLNSSHGSISYAVFCLTKKKQILATPSQTW